MALVSGLYTEVKNVSGSARTFGFLGPRGKRLNNNETYLVPGDLVATLGNGGRGNQRKIKALEKALYHGHLVVASPALYLKDGSNYYQAAPGEGNVVLGGADGWD